MRTKILCLCFMVFAGSVQAAEPLRVHFLNVGAGDAIVIQLPDKRTFMIDAGGKEHQAHVAEVLKNLGIERIETAIITHPHQNHFGSFDGLLDQFAFGSFLTNPERQAGDEGYGPLLEKIQSKGIPLEIVSAGATVPGLPEGMMLQVLNPETPTSGRLNPEALALLLSYQDTVILFLSDLETAEQEKVIGMIDPWQVDAVQVPHHGGALSPQFLKIFTRKLFVVSTGPNPENLPHSDIKELDGTVLRTDEKGDITLETDGKYLTYVTAR